MVCYKVHGRWTVSIFQASTYQINSSGRLSSSEPVERRAKDVLHWENPSLSFYSFCFYIKINSISDITDAAAASTLTSSKPPWLFVANKCGQPTIAWINMRALAIRHGHVCTIVNFRDFSSVKVKSSILPTCLGSYFPGWDQRQISYFTL